MREKHLGYRETVRKHWRTSCRSEEDLYVSTLKKWGRIYLTEGQKGFMEEKRGKIVKEDQGRNDWTSKRKKVQVYVV